MSFSGTVCTTSHVSFRLGWTMLRYGYQWAHKTALARSPYVRREAQFILTSPRRKCMGRVKMLKAIGDWRLAIFDWISNRLPPSHEERARPQRSTNTTQWFEIETRKSKVSRTILWTTRQIEEDRWAYHLIRALRGWALIKPFTSPWLSRGFSSFAAFLFAMRRKLAANFQRPLNYIILKEKAFVVVKIFQLYESHQKHMR